MPVEAILIFLSSSDSSSPSRFSRGSPECGGEDLVGDGAHIERDVIVVPVRRGAEATGPPVLTLHIEAIRKVRRPLLQELSRLLLVEKIEDKSVRFEGLVSANVLFPSLVAIHPIPHVAVAGAPAWTHVAGVALQPLFPEIPHPLSENIFVLHGELVHPSRQVAKPSPATVRLGDQVHDHRGDVIERNGAGGSGDGRLVDEARAEL